MSFSLTCTVSQDVMDARNAEPAVSSLFEWLATMPGKLNKVMSGEGKTRQDEVILRLIPDLTPCLDT